MNLTCRELTAGRHLVTLSGPLNVTGAQNVTRLFGEMAEQGVERIVVNLEGVPFIDGQGLAALIAGYKAFRGNGRHFHLVGIQDQPRLVFELTGFDCVFQIYENLVEMPATIPHSQSLPDYSPVAVAA